MNGMVWQGLALAAALSLVVAFAKLVFGPRFEGGRRSNRGSFTAAKLLTAPEQAMFWRLVEALPQPEFVVLAQVSFGALLRAKDGASRYSFSQKRADFVVVNKGFKVLAVVELDDSSHKGRENQDADRDAMLTQAGYKVLRYAQIPSVNQLMSDIAEP